MKKFIGILRHYLRRRDFISSRMKGRGLLKNGCQSKAAKKLNDFPLLHWLLKTTTIKLVSST
jgi:hypothetical protein